MRVKMGLSAMIAAGLLLCGCISPKEEAVSAEEQETVVLLHGLARSERSMRKIAAALREEGYRVVNHDYPSTEAGIEELSEMVFNAVDPQIRRARKVHFVTHSLGGIILRKHLQDHSIPKLGRVVMLAPPSRGSEVPDKLGDYTLFKWINGPAGNQLGTGADSIPLQLEAPDFELGIIAGDRSINPILSLLIPGPDDGKVALSRVKPQCYTDYICIHCTHTCMMWNGKVIAQIKHFLKDGSFAHY